MSSFCEHFDVEVETESATLSGFLTEQLEKIPEKDDTFTYKNLIFTVIESDAHRSLFVKVEVLPVEDETEEAEDKKPSDDNKEDE